MKKQEQIPLGIVMERQKVENPWTTFSWRTVAAITGGPKLKRWQKMSYTDRSTHFFAGTLILQLHRGETEGYRVNLSQRNPSLYVILQNITEEWPKPFLVTACPFEAEDYEISGEERTDRINMPEAISALVGHFISEHHIEEKFVKRKRKPHKLNKNSFPSEKQPRKNYG